MLNLLKDWSYCCQKGRKKEERNETKKTAGTKPKRRLGLKAGLIEVEQYSGYEILD